MFCFFFCLFVSLREVIKTIPTTTAELRRGKPGVESQPPSGPPRSGREFRERRSASFEAASRSLMKNVIQKRAIIFLKKRANGSIVLRNPVGRRRNGRLMSGKLAGTLL